MRCTLFGNRDLRHSVRVDSDEGDGRVTSIMGICTNAVFSASPCIAELNDRNDRKCVLVRIYTYRLRTLDTGALLNSTQFNMSAYFTSYVLHPAFVVH